MTAGTGHGYVSVGGVDVYWESWGGQEDAAVPLLLVHGGYGLVSDFDELLCRPYDWSAEVTRLPMPALLAFGDADSIPPAAAGEFFGLLGGGQRDAGWDGSRLGKSRLAVLPGVTHYDIIRSPLLPPAVARFLG